MNFDLTPERQMLQDGLRRYLRKASTPAARRSAAETPRGFSPEIWAVLAEMGVIGALLAEDDGGFGGAGFDLALVFEEMGRAGAVEPLIETGVTGGGLVAALGNETQRDSIDAVIAGTCQLAAALDEPAGRYDPAHVETRAEPQGSGYALSGHKSVVVNAAAADQVIVSARTSGDVTDRAGITLFLVPNAMEGMARRDFPLAGGGQLSEITFDRVLLAVDARLGAEGAAFGAIETARARATLAICAEALGLMETIKTLTADYLRTRKQFGTPIGKFQALQHRMADMLIEIEQARSAVVNLAGHLDADRDLRERHVSAAKALIGEAGRHVAEEGIQMHGGIGMTQDYALGHFARRLILTDHRFGDAMYHLERFTRLAVA